MYYSKKKKKFVPQQTDPARAIVIGGWVAWGTGAGARRDKSRTNMLGGGRRLHGPGDVSKLSPAERGGKGTMSPCRKVFQ